MLSPARTSAAISLATCAGLVLGGCTIGGTDGPDGAGRVLVPGEAASPSPSPTVLRVRTSGPTQPLTVVAAPDPVEQSLSTSRELFDVAPVAVLAPVGAVEAQRVAAHIAIGLGVPLLLGPPAGGTSTGTGTGPAEPAPATSADPEAAATGEPDAASELTATPGAAGAPAPDSPDGLADAVTAELDRLGTTTLVEVGDVAGVGGPAGTDGDADADADEITVVQVEPTAADVGAALGLDITVPAPTAPADPAAVAAEVAALEPGSASAGSGTADGGGQPRLPDVRRGQPLDDALALALDSPDALASIATARAAGVPVHLLPPGQPNPQASPSAIAALHSATAPHVLALGAPFATEPALEWKVRSARTGYQLPGGGQLLFPEHQFVALYGTPVTSALGLLGEQDLQASIQRAQEMAGRYAGLSDRTVVPMFEIIATVAAGSAGSDGNYSNEQPIEVLRPWVEAAGAAGVYVVLDLQPGRSDFLTQAQQYEELLLMPHVGLALDPEWRLGPDERPLQRIGTVGAAEVNSVIQWLADLTNTHGLPPKMFVLHQFQLRMIGDRAAVDTGRPELHVVLHVDGQGSQPAKQGTWGALQKDAPAGVAWGWKNFVDEDLPMLTPEQTVRGVTPLPDLVTYQ